MAASSGAETSLELEPFAAQLGEWYARALRDRSSSVDPAGLPRLEWRPHAPRIEVDSIEAWRMPATELSAGAVVLAVHSGDKIGWGEARVGWEREGVWTAATETLAPALVGEHFGAPSELPIIWSDVPAVPAARAGLEAAAWDLFARVENVALAVAMGHEPRAIALAGSLPVGMGTGGSASHLTSLGLEELARLGYAAGIVPVRPNHDRVLIQAVRESPVPVILDGAGSYGRAHTEALRAMTESGADLIMNPFDPADVVLASRLRRAAGSPVSLPGSSKASVESAHFISAARVFHVDPGLTGLSEALRIIDHVAEHSGDAWVHSSAGTILGVHADLAAASRPGVNRPCRIPLSAPGASGSSGLHGSTGDTGERLPREGVGPLPGVGLGVTPAPEWLAGAVAYRRFRA
jgi:O-succinylbenzoate synthase